jgi:hypothetical protein
VSYDVYFWHQITADVDDVLDDLAEDDVSKLIARPSVGAFRDQLLARLPDWSTSSPPARRHPPRPATSHSTFLPAGSTTTSTRPCT